MPETLAHVDTLLHTIGTRVRDARKAKGFPRRILAEKSGVSPRYLALLEAGEGNTSIAMLARVADALNKPVDWFLSHKPNSDFTHRFAKASPETQNQIRQLLGTNTRAKRICLIGLRGAGKSTLGKRLADEMKVPFVELNSEIETQAGMPLAEIIALYGPEGYRKLEADALTEIHNRYDSLVLAVAGGIVSDSETYNTLLSTFHTIWLRASPQEHMNRVRAQGDERPMAGNPAAMEQLKSLLTNREGQYSRAIAQLDTSGTSLEKATRGLLKITQKILS